jgi:hypothetical protein
MNSTKYLKINGNSSQTFPQTLKKGNTSYQEPHFYTNCILWDQHNPDIKTKDITRESKTNIHCD